MHIFIKNIIIVSFSLITVNIYSQSLPIDFNNTNHDFASFGGCNFSRTSDPLRPNNTVGKITNNGGDIFEGVYIDIEEPINLDSSKMVYVELFPDLNDSVLVQIKLEQSQSGQSDIFVEHKIKTSTWLNDSFDFGSAIPVGMQEPIVGKGQYKRLTIFLAPGTTTSGNLYLDNISAFTGKNQSGGGNTDELWTKFDSLVWEDEFNRVGLFDNENWHPQIIPPNGGGWFNGEIQHYTERIENSYCDGESLHIIARKETYDYEGSVKQHTSARLNSKFAFTYGRVDVRAKLPYGNGTWPAIWMLGTNIGETGNYWGQDANTVGWPKCGEIDIMESWGHNPNYVSSAVHCQAQFGSVPTGGTTLDDPYNDYHLYSMVWTPEKLTFYVDSIETYEYFPTSKNGDNWPFTEDQYILLNVAILPSISNNFDTARMQVDFVKVYQERKVKNTNSITNMPKLRIFPNPVDRTISWENLNISKTVNYTIIDRIGSICQKGLIEKGANHLDVDLLRPGIYYLKIESTKSVQSIRFIKN